MNRYELIKHYRIATRTNSVVIFNSHIGSCIELDPLSYSLVTYIEKNNPNTTELINYAADTNIPEQEIHDFINCLKELGFVNEIR